MGFLQRKNDASPEWIDADHVVVGGQKFITLGDTGGTLDAARLFRFDALDSDDERFVLAKTKYLIGRYVDVLTAHEPETILELGIYRGGSVAFIEELVHPRKFVAVELDPEPRAALDRYLLSESRHTRIRTYYGVSQDDEARVTEIVDSEFNGDLDVVIDDASHFVAETRASFNMLFPRVRPDGLYLIEDWSWVHTSTFNLRPEKVPLSVFVFEVTMAAASVPGLIDSVTLYPELAVVRRGPAPIDRATFDVSKTYSEQARGLVNGLAGP